MDALVKPWLAAALLALPAAAVFAEDKAKGGWTALFDGNGTAAWRGYNKDAMPPGWLVEAGTLKTVPNAEGRADIITREKYGDFELELEWKVAPGGNSGVFYRAAEQPGAEIWHTAPEMQVLDDDKHRDGMKPTTSSGALYDLIPPRDKALKPAGEWNKARVVARGSHIEHWLNGKKVLEYEQGSPEFQKLVAASKFKDMPRFAREKEGHIALQHHGEEVWFRNVRVRRL